jgi:hypothetical protein
MLVVISRYCNESAHQLQQEEVVVLVRLRCGRLYWHSDKQG